MITDKTIWIDYRFGKNGWGIIILPIVIILLPLVMAFHIYAVWFWDFTNAADVRLVITIALIFMCILFFGVLKYVWLLRKAPQRISRTQNLLQINYYFGIERTLPINRIISAKYAKHGVLESLFSPYSSRQPVLKISFIDGPTLYLNGDYTQDSDLVSLIRNVSK